MTTSQRSSTMSDQYRTVVQAVVKLTTQVRRVADALAAPQTTGYQPVGHMPEPTTTPVTLPPVSETTTGDDARRDRYAAAIWERNHPGRRYADCEHPWMADAEEDAEAVMVIANQEMEQLADKVREQQATIERLRATLGEVLAAFSRAHPAGQPDTTLGYLAEHPIHPDDFARWRAVL